MRLMSFKASGDKVQPVYCNKLVSLVLPFSHGRVDIIEGSRFEAKVIGDRTVVSLKTGAGASEEPAFKCPFPSKVGEAIRSLRAAACARVHQVQATGERICL